MKTLKIGFLWHMHQPYYRCPITDESSLPFVRMHGVRAYYDMGSLLYDYPNIKLTFNFVPSLLEQLLEYTEKGKRDKAFELTLKNFSDLTYEEKILIVDRFFDCTHSTMVNPYPRYKELLLKRGKPKNGTYKDSVSEFTKQDIFDLQVWFNLTWIGFRGISKIEGLEELKRKGRNFTEEEKLFVINSHIKLLKEIIPLYKTLAERGQIELTTTPYYHPIIPLIIDTEIGKRSMPDRKFPTRFSYPEDAEAQIKKAVSYHKDIFGIPPYGLWPSEGSVCPEMIPILEQNQIKWIATDEGNLFKSLDNISRDALYTPYKAIFKDSEVSIVFRDRVLSDLIGFTYSKVNPSDAVNDFCVKLYSILDKYKNRDEEPLVSVILDGENPWEQYLNAGKDFLTELYSRLSYDPKIETVKFGDFIEKNPPQKIINKLHSGSWIESNFKIWIGSPEKNNGWEYLGKVRKYIQEKLEEGKISEGKKTLIFEELYRAEGSDWFWWYGDDFSTENDKEFDRLFRTHLKNIFEYLEEPPPEFLSVPICKSTRLYIKPISSPTSYITPQLDGRVTDYFEWLGGGKYDLTPLGSSMYKSISFFSTLYFGFDIKNLYIRLDKSDESLLKDYSTIIMELYITVNKDIFKIKWNIEYDKSMFEEVYGKIYKSEDTIKFEQVEGNAVAIFGKIMELSIPLEKLGIYKGTKFYFSIKISQEDGVELERIPPEYFLKIEIPESEFDTTMWI